MGLDQIKQGIVGATWAVWGLVRPLLQLSITLIIIYSFVRALGVDFGGLKTSSAELSIQTVLAFVVVGGFTIAALLSSAPVDALKDLALVVVGFYFGTKAKAENGIASEGESRPDRQAESVEEQGTNISRETP